MLDTRSRWGLARTAGWKVGETALETPAVASSADGTLALIRGNGRASLVSDGEELASWEVGTAYPLQYLDIKGRVDIDEVTVLRATPGDVEDHLVRGDGELIVIENAFELRRDARSFVRTLCAIRRNVGNDRVVLAPGIATPANLALLVYAGVDVVDDSLVTYQGRNGMLTRPEGTFVESGDVSDASRSALDEEMSLVRRMIGNGRLRELVEMRAPADPWSVAVLRLLDDMYDDVQERGVPVVGGRIACNTPQSLRRPDVERFKRRVRERYEPPKGADVLLLLPCSARKPYSSSRTHKLFSQVLWDTGLRDRVHEVIVTSPLGTVPRELELFHPAAHYDIPVTGDWTRDEAVMVSEQVDAIVSHGYGTVISHLGSEGDLIDVPGAIDTSHGEPTSRESLKRLAEVVKETCDGSAIGAADIMASRARFQFGIGGEALADGCRVRGKYPFLKLFDKSGQRGMMTPDRGLISLTIDGGRALSHMDGMVVRMEDFELKGNLFAVGVEGAGDDIRIGDDVIIKRGDEVVGVGVAQMSGDEMGYTRRGIAVKVRHRL